MPVRMNKGRVFASVLFTQSCVVRRLAGAIIVIGAFHYLLVQVSAGRQVNQEVMKRKVVIAESLLLNSSVAGIGAILGVGPRNDAGMTFFNLKNSNSLYFGHIESPFLSIKPSELNEGMKFTVLPPGNASIGR
jgi:hypothetical protein